MDWLGMRGCGMGWGGMESEVLSTKFIANRSRESLDWVLESCCTRLDGWTAKEIMILRNGKGRGRCSSLSISKRAPPPAWPFQDPIVQYRGSKSDSFHNAPSSHREPSAWVSLDLMSSSKIELWNFFFFAKSVNGWTWFTPTVEPRPCRVSPMFWTLSSVVYNFSWSSQGTHTHARRLSTLTLTHPVGLC